MRKTPPQTALDEIDRRILARLQQDGRLATAELAEAVGLSASPCWRRVRALEADGTIRRYVALLDPARVGLAVTVFCSVSLKTQEEKALDVFERAILKLPEVMECYLMTGDADYLLRVVMPDLGAYERFLMDHITRIPTVASIRSSFALRAVKQRTDLPLTQLGA
jgi:Lrp/AsnC family leucine-responsive transcriptional regulator